MKVVMMLQNFWYWSGGFSQYVYWHCNGSQIPIPEDENHILPEYYEYTQRFYKCMDAQEAFKSAFSNIANRFNRYTNVYYRNDPTIMAWELANEPMPYHLPNEYTAWLKDAAAYIKRVDPKHLVTVGSSGPMTDKNYQNNSDIENIDYMTMHVWPERWNWFDPMHEETLEKAMDSTRNYTDQVVQIVKSLRKPLVIEAVALARDRGSFSPTSSTRNRDAFMLFLFDLVYKYAQKELIAGINVWGWSGSGYPNKPGEYWQANDTLTGDTPDQRQGRYAIYSNDTTVLAIHECALHMALLPVYEELPGFVYTIGLVIIAVMGFVIVLFIFVTCRAKPTVLPPSDAAKAPLEPGEHPTENAKANEGDSRKEKLL